MQVKHRILPTIAISLKFSSFFDGKWKMDDAGNLAKDADGNPIYVNTAGGESSVNGSTISSLNGEARRFRERAEAAESKLQVYDGIDATAARDALEKITQIDQKKLIDAGEVDRVKAEIGKQYDAKLLTSEQRASDLEKRLNNTIITNAFATSKFAKEKLAIPIDLAQSHFGNRFKIENDKIVALDQNGAPVYSNKKMGEVADFEEALELIIDGYSGKDSILKGDGHSGTGNNGGGGNPAGGGRTLKRSTYEAMNESDKARASMDMRDGKITVVD